MSTTGVAVMALYALPSPDRRCWRKRITRLLLVRHAGDAGDTGPTLSARGVAQAASPGRRLTGLPVTALYTSPLRRASERVAALSACIGLPAEALGLLGDNGAGGVWRGQEVMELLLAQCPDAGALVVPVTHLPIIRPALCHVLGLEAGNEGQFRVDQCGITEVVGAVVLPIIASVDDISHLQGLDG